MLIWLSFAVVLLIIALNDFLFFRIENEYVLFLFLLYAISYCFGVSGEHFVEALKLAGITFIICFIMNQFDLIGGGDVKMLMPMILFAENNMFDFIWGTSIGGLVVAMIYICVGKQVANLRKKLFQIFLSLKKEKFQLLRFVLLSLYRIKPSSVKFNIRKAKTLKQEVPYGVAMACGGFFVIFDVMFR